MDVNKSVFLYNNKHFDKLGHHQLNQLLKYKNTNSRDIIIIRSFLKPAVVRVDNTKIEKINITEGIRQDCLLSLALFNIYSEEIFKKVLQD